MSRMTLLPTTGSGRLAARLLAACAAIFGVAIVVSLFADDTDDSGGFEVFRFVVGNGFLLTAAGSAVLGVIAVARDRDRSVAAFAAVVLGLLAVTFALGDMVTQ